MNNVERKKCHEKTTIYLIILKQKKHSGTLHCVRFQTRYLPHLYASYSVSVLLFPTLKHAPKILIVHFCQPPKNKELEKLVC